MFRGRFYGSASSRLVLSDFTLPTIFCPAIRDFKGESTRHLSGYETVGPPLRAPAAVSTKSWLCLLVWDGHAMDHTYERRNIWTRGKSLWFSQQWSHYRRWIPEKVATKLTITARRLDAPVPPPEISAGPTFTRHWKAFMLGGISFPTPGSWEITGRYEDAEVRFVVWVMSDATAKQAAPLSIVVDKSCRIERASDPVVLGDHVAAFRDDAISHVESVLSSQHIEEKIIGGQRSLASLSGSPNRNTSSRIQPTNPPYSSFGIRFRRIGS